MGTEHQKTITVLIVEDHPDQRELLAVVLQREGYRVDTAKNGLEALEKLRKDRVNVIISDIMMPKMDGFELLRKIRSNLDFKNTYVVLLTAKAHEADLVRGLDLGANDYITKPFSFSELLARIRVWHRIVLQQEDLEDQAYKDSLTGLFNRRALEMRAKQEFARVQADNVALHLFILDIDNFKSINDTYGHQTGDKVLRKVAKTIGNTTDNTSVFGRYGGEEFCLIVSEISLESAIARAERMRKKVEKAIFRTSSSKFSVTLSVGMSSTFLKKYPDWKELFVDADSALYAAKSSGKNCVKVYLPELLVTRAHPYLRTHPNNV